MDIELIIDENVEKEKIVIYAKQHTERITDIINKISIEDKSKIVGFIDTEVYILQIDNIWTFYIENNKVYAKTKDKIYKVKYRMYELEEMLKNTSFIRISNSEIINLKEIESLDLGIVGTVAFKFKDGSTTYASRRSINRIKDYLNL